MALNAVAYFRVSTTRQGQSGLGLDAQRQSVIRFTGDGGWHVVREFVEIESGRRDDRPQLLDALKACRLHRATLIVAKLDRLARNAHFLLGLRDSGIEFIAVDMPHANRLTISIMAMVAEEEAQAISARTRVALAAAKDRGIQLGTPANLTNVDRLRGSKIAGQLRRQRSLAWAVDVHPVIEEIRADGARSLRQIAARLNEKAIPTPQGATWYPALVKRVLDAAA